MKIGVYGLGRFGSLWARILSERFTVVAYNRTKRVEEGLPFSLGALEDVAACDAVFLCTAISSIEHVLEELAPHLGPGTIVADTCSVKVYPVESMKRLLPGSVSILGTHPMFGPDSARNGLAGLPIILCPVRLSSAELAFWKETFSSFRLRVVEMSAEEHDREAAFTQGITHFVGRVLKDLDLKPSEIGTVGYRKLLEIMDHTCNDPWQLFLDLQHYNPHTVEMRRRLQDSLRRILSKLEQ